MKKRRTSEEIFPILERVERGELTRDKFCRMTGLKESSFQYWRKKFRTQEKVGHSFVQLPDVEMRTGGYEMEIEFSSGITIRFSALVPVEYLSALIQKG